MLDRRRFIGSIALPSAAVLTAFARSTFAGENLFDAERWEELLDGMSTAESDPAKAATDEDFWSMPQQAFAIDRSMINLNNGGISPSPRVVLDAFRRYIDLSNTAPSYYMWRVLEPQRETVRERVAKHWGVSPEEIAFTRNASESLQICQLGLDLNPGDEVLTTTQDYPRMLTTFRQRERRDGIRLVTIKLPIPCENDDIAVARFEEAITPKTRMILMSHVINITGQILPVKRIVEMARKKNGGIPVVVDGAHAFAHLNFKISDLGCDYYGVSLHKWLFAPHGTGLLYVRRDKIKDLWSLMATDSEQSADIRKFEEIGTHPAANALAVGEAMAFHEALGDARKEARMRWMRNRWADRLVSSGNGMKHAAKLHTSLDPRFSCGIGTFALEGIDCMKISEWLWATHKIHATTIKHAEFEGVRVTPSVYTTLAELDRFSEVMDELMRKGLPV